MKRLEEIHGRSLVSYVDRQLQQFADSLKRSPDKFVHDGVKDCQRVLNRLKKECSENRQLSFSIAEVHYAGSVAKHTNISYSSYHPDFDLVLKLHRYNNDGESSEQGDSSVDYDDDGGSYRHESSDDYGYGDSESYDGGRGEDYDSEDNSMRESYSDESDENHDEDDITDLFAEALGFFRKVIERNARTLKVDVDSIEVHRHYMYFEFNDGTPVDLLPAEADLTLAEIRNKIYYHKKKEVPKSPRKWTLYSSSLVVDQVKFMKDQDSFTHKLARLAKYWLKYLNYEEIDIDGGSLMMELLAVAAVKQLDMEGARGEPLLQGFYYVMCLIGRLNRLEVAFKRHQGHWMLMTGNDLKCGGGGQLPGVISPPFIVEPTNLCHNLLEEMSKDTMRKLMSKGRAKANHIQDTHCKYFDAETLSFQR